MFAHPEPVKPRPRPSEQPNPGPWLALFAAGAAARVVPLLIGRSMAGPEWLPIASNLAHGLGLAANAAAGPIATAQVPPLAPWLASGVLRVAGPHPVALALAFAVLGALVPLVVASLGMAVYGGGAGRWAGWICALDPLLVLAPAIESVAALALATATLATAAWIKTPRPGRALGVGMLWGIGALAHPALLGLPLLMAAWAWVPLGLTVAPRDRIRQTLLVFAGLATIVAPWTLRNAGAVHGFVPVNTGNGVALLAASSHRAWTDPALRGAPLTRDQLVAEHPEVAGRAEVATDRLALERAAAHAAEHAPEALAVIAPRAFGFAIAPLHPFDPWLTIAGALLLPFWLWGATRAATGARRLFQSVPVVIAAWFLARTLVFGTTTAARVPVEPMLALLAAVSLDDARRRARAWSHGLRVIPGRS